MPETITPEVCAWMMSTTSFDQALPSLEELAHRPGWMARAACRGEDTALFFPTLGGNAARARVICSICPVRSDCLAYARTDADTGGIWGGTTQRERRGMRVVA